MLWYLAVFAFTFIVSYLGTFVVRKVTAKKGWVAQPSADRWHETPTALHGGVGIFVAFLLGAALVVLGFYNEYIPFGLEESTQNFYRTLLVLLLGVTIIFLVGLIDDFLHLKPGIKLLGELIAVSLVIFFGIGYNITTFQWVDILFSYLWFVGIVNAVNLLDNMDGVSSGVVIIGTTGVALLGVVGYSDAYPPSVYIGGILVAATLGFWLHNKPPAKIFMGDSGSLVLGFVFAAVTIPSHLNAHYIPKIDFSIWDKVLQLLIAITLASIPILDTTLVTITRLMRGQSPSVGGRDHSTHRLAQSGLSHWQTLKILYSVAAICTIVALIMVKYPQIGFLVFSGVFLSMTIVAAYLASVRIQVAPIKKEGWQQLITSIAYRLPLIKMVMDVMIIAMSFHVAYLVRFDFKMDYAMSQAMIRSLPLVVLGCLIANFTLKVYDFNWKTARSRDAVIYFGSALLGTFLSLSFVTLATSFGLGFSRGAFVLFFMIYFFALGITRYSYRFIDELVLQARLRQGTQGKIPLILYGTKDEAKSFISEIIHNSTRWDKYKIIGIVNSSPSEYEKRFEGIPVKSETDWLKESFDDQPEILLIDDTIDQKKVRLFADQIGKNLRVRKLVYKILDIA